MHPLPPLEKATVAWLASRIRQIIPYSSGHRSAGHTEFGGIKPLLRGLALMILEDSMQGVKREKQPRVLPSCDTYEPQ